MNYLSPSKHPRLNEAVGFLLFALALLLFVSLVSFHPMDPSFNVSRNPLSTAPVYNWAGRFGAGLADLLLMGLGFPAFLLPLFFVIFSWKWFRSRALINPGIKVSGFIILMGTSCALLSLLFQDVFNWFDWSLKAGGLIGEILSGWFLAKFNFVGSLILLSSLFFISLFVATRFSFSALMAWIRERGRFLPIWREKWDHWRKERTYEIDRKELERKQKREEEGHKQEKPVIAQKLVEIKSQSEKPASPKVPAPPPREQDFAAPAAPPRLAKKSLLLNWLPSWQPGCKIFRFPALSFCVPLWLWPKLTKTNCCSGRNCSQKNARSLEYWDR